MHRCVAFVVQFVGQRHGMTASAVQRSDSLGYSNASTDATRRQKYVRHGENGSPCNGLCFTIKQPTTGRTQFLTALIIRVHFGQKFNHLAINRQPVFCNIPLMILRIISLTRSIRFVLPLPLPTVHQSVFVCPPAFPRFSR